MSSYVQGEFHQMPQNKTYHGLYNNRLGICLTGLSDLGKTSYFTTTYSKGDHQHYFRSGETKRCQVKSATDQVVDFNLYILSKKRNFKYFMACLRGLTVG